MGCSRSRLLELPPSLLNGSKPESKSSHHAALRSRSYAEQLNFSLSKVQKQTTENIRSKLRTPLARIHRVAQFLSKVCICIC